MMSEQTTTTQVREEKETLITKHDLVKAWWRWTTAVDWHLVTL